MLGYPSHKELGGMQVTVNSRWRHYESNFLVLVTVLPCGLTYATVRGRLSWQGSNPRPVFLGES